MVKNGKWTESLTSWREWFDRYLDTGDVRDMPPSWSDSQVLPFTSVITEGDAGTGKTYSLYNFFHTMPDGAVWSYAAKGTDTFLTYSTAFPSSMRHVSTQNTLCKLFRVRFGQPAVQNLLETVKNDSELSRKCVASAGWTFTRKDARDLSSAASRGDGGFRQDRSGDGGSTTCGKRLLRSVKKHTPTRTRTVCIWHTP